MVHASLLPGADWWRHQLLGYDHLPLFLELQIKTWALKEDELKLKWNWREADWEAFRAEVDHEVDLAAPRSSRWTLDFLEEAILGSARRNVGMVRVKGEGRKWVTPELRSATKRRNRLGRDINAHREAWLESCREERRLTREAKSASWWAYATPWAQRQIRRGPGASSAPLGGRRRQRPPGTLCWSTKERR